MGYARCAAILSYTLANVLLFALAGAVMLNLLLNSFDTDEGVSRVTLASTPSPTVPTPNSCLETKFKGRRSTTEARTLFLQAETVYVRLMNTGRPLSLNVDGSRAERNGRSYTTQRLLHGIVPEQHHRYVTNALLSPERTPDL